MKSLRLALVMAAFGVATAHAADEGLMIKLQLSENDRTVASPTLLVAAGETASVQISDRVRVEVLASESGGVADLRFKLYVNGGDGLKAAGTPRIAVTTGETGSLAFTNDGQSFKLTVTPTKATVPSKT